MFPNALFSIHWWDSDLIPRFTKIFENWENFTVIVLGIKNSAFTQNLSPNAHPGVEYSHSASWNYGLGEVVFRIKIFQNFWYHRNQRSKEEWLFDFHPIKPLNSSVFRLLKFSFFENWKPWIVLKLCYIYSDFVIYIFNWDQFNGSRFSKKLNFKRRKTLEFKGLMGWKSKSHCSFERWLRWYQKFWKILMLKTTSPSP